MGAEFIECITKKDLELLNAFINEKNPDLNAEDGGATIPLNMAVHVGNIDVFYYLVEQGCDISSTKGFGVRIWPVVLTSTGYGEAALAAASAKHLLTYLK